MFGLQKQIHTTQGTCKDHIHSIGTGCEASAEDLREQVVASEPPEMLGIYKVAFRVRKS